MAYHRIGKSGRRYWGKKGAGIFFTDGKKVLLLKRSNKGDNGGTWGLPGGKAEDGETTLGTALRECKEECGDNIQGSRFDSLESIDGHYRWTTFFYKVKKRFHCNLSDEHTAWEWVDFNHLDGYKLHPKLNEEIDRYMRVIDRNFHDISFKEWLKS